jgi:hypothetical protein
MEKIGNFSPENLEVYYNLANKSLGLCQNEFENSLFKKSFIYASSAGKYVLMNSMHCLLKEKECNNSDLTVRYVQGVLLKYYSRCPDFSNIFIKLLYEIISAVKNCKYSKNEFKLNYQKNINKFKDLLITNVI